MTWSPAAICVFEEGSCWSLSPAGGGRTRCRPSAALRRHTSQHASAQMPESCMATLRLRACNVLSAVRRGSAGTKSGSVRRDTWSALAICPKPIGPIIGFEDGGRFELVISRSISGWDSGQMIGQSTRTGPRCPEGSTNWNYTYTSNYWLWIVLVYSKYQFWPKMFY